MSRLRDRYPARGTDPLARVRSYLDRRSGAVDPARDRRKERTRARSPEVAGAGAGETGLQTSTVRTGWDPVSLATDDDAGVLVTVDGVEPDGHWACTASFSQLTSAGSDQWLISAWPQATNTVAVRILNKSGNTHDLGSGTVCCICWRVP